jgi:single-strand DNA-binding protein
LLTCYTVLSLATKDSWKDRAGEWQSRTEWHRCIWGAKFAAFAAHIKTGENLRVEGELRSREYEKDGVKHRIVEIRTKSILKLDRAKQQTEAVPQEAEPTDVPPF